MTHQKQSWPIREFVQEMHIGVVAKVVPLALSAISQYHVWHGILRQTEVGHIEMQTYDGGETLLVVDSNSERIWLGWLVRNEKARNLSKAWPSSNMKTPAVFTRLSGPCYEKSDELFVTEIRLASLGLTRHVMPPGWMTP